MGRGNGDLEVLSRYSIHTALTIMHKYGPIPYWRLVDSDDYGIPASLIQRLAEYEFIELFIKFPEGQLHARLGYQGWRTLTTKPEDLRREEKIAALRVIIAGVPAERAEYEKARRETEAAERSGLGWDEQLTRANLRLWRERAERDAKPKRSLEEIAAALAALIEGK